MTLTQLSVHFKYTFSSIRRHLKRENRFIYLNKNFHLFDAIIIEINVNLIRYSLKREKFREFEKMITKNTMKCNIVYNY